MIWRGKRGQGRKYFTKILLPLDFKLFPRKTILQKFPREPFPPTPYHDEKTSVIHFSLISIFLS
jgi:hypothetical protein